MQKNWYNAILARKIKGHHNGLPDFCIAYLKNFGVLPAYFLLRFVAYIIFYFPINRPNLYSITFMKSSDMAGLRSLFKLYRNYYYSAKVLLIKWW